MAVVWLIEIADHEPKIYDSLVGDFPVRRIASIPSLRNVYAMEPAERRPHLIIVRDLCTSDPLVVFAAIHVLCKINLDCVVALSSDCLPAWLELAEKNGLPRLMLSRSDRLAFKTQIDLLLSLRQSEGKGQNGDVDVLVIGDIEFKPKINAIQIQGATAESLLPKEARILEVLARSRNTCVSRAFLAEQVWPDVRVSERTLDSHVSRLRKKIEASFECGIESIYGEGYCLRVAGEFR